MRKRKKVLKEYSETKSERERKCAAAAGEGGGLCRKPVRKVLEAV